MPHLLVKVITICAYGNMCPHTHTQHKHIYPHTVCPSFAVQMKVAFHHTLTRLLTTHLQAQARLLPHAYEHVTPYDVYLRWCHCGSITFASVSLCVFFLCFALDYMDCRKSAWTHTM